MSLVDAQHSLFPTCSVSSFALTGFPGLQIEQVNTDIVEEATTSLYQGASLGRRPVVLENLQFCNVSVTYTHDTYPNDEINVHVFLPPKDLWNGRLMAVGGGGWGAGLFAFMLDNMKAAVGQGYVTIGTDAGHAPDDRDPAEWAFQGPGQANKHLIELMGYTAYTDLALIGKTVSEQYFGIPPSYSYWLGCSQGGRQGLAVAQHFPEIFNGILSIAPAINMPASIASMYYPQLVMNKLGEYPPACEMDAIRAAVVDECDALDGVRDRIVSAPDACKFDPFDFVGQPTACPPDKPQFISKGAVEIAIGAWSGAQTADGYQVYHGLNPDAALTGRFATCNTKCTTDGRSCNGLPFLPAKFWFESGLAKQARSEHSSMSHGIFDELTYEGIKKWHYALGSNDSNLSAFGNQGGKLLLMHGLADEILAPRGTRAYYEEVIAQDPQAVNHVKHYEVPGMPHCPESLHYYPEDAFQALVDWVEKEVVPDTLMGVSKTGGYRRPICAYPLVARYDGTGDVSDPRNYHCAEEHLSSTPIRLLLKRVWKYLSRK